MCDGAGRQAFPGDVKCAPEDLHRGIPQAISANCAALSTKMLGGEGSEVRVAGGHHVTKDR